jgi:hypothetical protein
MIEMEKKIKLSIDLLLLDENLYLELLKDILQVYFDINDYLIQL